jgi:hypothetical protein
MWTILNWFLRNYLFRFTVETSLFLKVQFRFKFRYGKIMWFVSVPSLSFEKPWVSKELFFVQCCPSVCAFLWPLDSLECLMFAMCKYLYHIWISDHKVLEKYVQKEKGLLQFGVCMHARARARTHTHTHIVIL